MKKYVNIAFIYVMAGIVCGVFYREFTKIMGFTGKTTLAFTHLHLIALGGIVFLIVGIFAILTNVEKQKNFKRFMVVYNIGLPFAVVMLLVRGVTQVLGTPLSAGLTAAISGMSGIAHIILTIGLVLMFLSLKKSEVIVSRAKS